MFDYTIRGQIVPRVRSHDYLGVHVKDDLNWDKHIGKISSKASQSLGMLRRNLSSCPTEVKRQAYTTITRPKLEYASCAWSPHTAKCKKQLESVQNAAARFCTGDYRKRQSVSGMVTNLGWDTLATRRLLQDVTLFYKIQYNLVNIIFPAVIQPARLSSTRANHPFKKQVISATINPYKYSYFVRTVLVWNYLPACAVNAPTVSAFQAAALPALRAY